MSRAKNKPSPQAKFSPKQARQNYHPYLRDATEAFIRGTGCQTPDEAIRKEKRTMEEWLDTIAKYREQGKFRNSSAA